MTLALLAGGELLVAAGLVVLRRRRVGAVPGGWPRLVATATVVALVAGTALPIPGVVLAVPVIAGWASVLWRSPWWVGDLAALVLIAAAGAALGYQAAATLDPDTGSYGDQGALWLAVAGGIATLVTLGVGLWPRAGSAQR